MGLPGQRRSKSSKRRRAAHFALRRLTLAACAKCQAMVRPHTACQRCGTYRGRSVVETSAMIRAKRLERRARKAPSAAGA